MDNHCAASADVGNGQFTLHPPFPFPSPNRIPNLTLPLTRTHQANLQVSLEELRAVIPANLIHVHESDPSAPAPTPTAVVEAIVAAARSVVAFFATFFARGGCRCDGKACALQEATHTRYHCTSCLRGLRWTGFNSGLTCPFLSGWYHVQQNRPHVRGTVRVFRQKLCTRGVPLSFTPLLRLKRCHACDQWLCSRLSTTSYRYHWKLRPNTEGNNRGGGEGAGPSSNGGNVLDEDASPHTEDDEMCVVCHGEMEQGERTVKLVCVRCAFSPWILLC
jgi:hypothetical protein